MKQPAPSPESQPMYDDVTNDYNTLENGVNDFVKFLELSTQFYSLYDEVCKHYNYYNIYVK